MSFAFGSPRSARLMLTGSTSLPKVGTQRMTPASAPLSFSSLSSPSIPGAKPSLYPIPFLPGPRPHVKPLRLFSFVPRHAGKDLQKSRPAFETKVALARLPRLRHANRFAPPAAVADAEGKLSLIPRPRGILKVRPALRGPTHARRVVFGENVVQEVSRWQVEASYWKDSPWYVDRTQAPPDPPAPCRTQIGLAVFLLVLTLVLVNWVMEWMFALLRSCLY